MSFEGSCQCGAVTFTVDADVPTKAVSCNCSICRCKGLLLAFFPAAQFTLTSGEDQLSGYRFNTKQIEHHFCRTCGTQPFSSGAGPDGAPMRAVNLRCVPEIDLDGLTLDRVNGAEK